MSNPGLYTQLDCVHHYVKALCGGTPPVQRFANNPDLLPAVGIFAAAFLWAIVLLILSRRAGSGVAQDCAGVVAFVLLNVVVVLSVSSFSPHTVRAKAAHYDRYVTSYEEQYDTDLRQWLTADYGITVDEQQTERLRDGEAVAVRIDGSLTPVSLIDAGNHHAAIQRGGGNIIAPNGGVR